MACRAERDAAGLVVRGFRRVHVGIERRLRVDDNGARFRHAHQQVRPQRSAFGAGDVLLLGEIAVLGHARELHHATQRDLAPAAAHFGTAQRGRQVAGLALQEILHLDEIFDLPGDLAG